MVKKLTPAMLELTFSPGGEIGNKVKNCQYFFASDASAIIEHTNRVIYLEDDDVAAVQEEITVACPLCKVRREHRADFGV